MVGYSRSRKVYPSSRMVLSLGGVTGAEIFCRKKINTMYITGRNKQKGKCSFCFLCAFNTTSNICIFYVIIFLIGGTEGLFFVCSSLSRTVHSLNVSCR